MSTNRAQLGELRARLVACASEVTPRAEAFHRVLAVLLTEVEDALSWRGGFGLGQGASHLRIQVDGLAELGLALRELFAGIDQVERQRREATQALGRVGAQALRDRDAMPARLERLRVGLLRLGRQVTTADELRVDQRLCAEAGAETVRLVEALGLWLTLEATLAKVRPSNRTAALETDLPELAERLSRDGPTPPWRDALQSRLASLAQLADREPPRELGETEKIIKALPRWARVLGTAAEDCADLAERFKARRRHWPDEDDRAFVELLEQARALERRLLERAAALRTSGIAELEARCALAAELVGPDPGLDESVRDLRQAPGDDPRDHEDWCELLREANEALQNRVKRSETLLLEQLAGQRAECRRRFEALNLLPCLDDKESRRAHLSEAFDALSQTDRTAAPLDLLDQVARTRALNTELSALESAIRQDQADLTEARARIRQRALWLMARSQALAIALPAALIDQLRDIGPNGLGSNLESNLELNLEQARLRLDDQQCQLSEAEAQCARACGEACEAARQRLAQVRAVLPADRLRDCGPPLATEPAAIPPDLDGAVDALEQTRAALDALVPLLDGEEQSLRGRAQGLERDLESLPADALGYNDRGEREAILRQFQQWRPAARTDPVERIAALAELIENAEHVLRRIASAARRLQERREALRERLRRFNALFLQGYCPDLYPRVEALCHPPDPSHWPPGDEEAQLAEAEHLFRLLERQALRLAAREIEEMVRALEDHARRTQDPEVRALIEEVRGLPLEQQPPARLRRRLADRLLGLRLVHP